VQNDKSAVLRSKCLESTVECIAVSDKRRRVTWIAQLQLGNPNSDDSATPPSDLVDCRVNEQAMQPGVETLGVAQTRKVAPRTNQRFLDRILRCFWIPKDQAGGRVQPRCSSANKHGEGVAIAVACLFHVRPLVHGPPYAARRTWPRSHGMAAGNSDSFRAKSSQP